MGVEGLCERGEKAVLENVNTLRRAVPVWVKFGPFPVSPHCGSGGALEDSWYGGGNYVNYFRFSATLPPVIQVYIQVDMTDFKISASLCCSFDAWVFSLCQPPFAVIKIMITRGLRYYFKY